MAIPSQQQKRRFPRVGLRVPVKYQVRGVSAVDSTICDNISESGLRIISQRYIPPATPVMLEIDLKSRVLHPVGRIAWAAPLSHSDRNQIGIEFLELGLEEKKYLNNFVASVVETLRMNNRKGDKTHGS
jgi:hypothetical protein